VVGDQPKFTMVVTSIGLINDDRVQPGHVRKMTVAREQDELVDRRQVRSVFRAA
jgi:hypothetical protein